MTWKEVEALDREIVVVVPCGSLEQHGPHLPLITDTLLATAVAEAVEAAIPDQVLLTPSLWLGASSHHLPFAGTVSTEFDGYRAQVESVVDSLSPHGFRKFLFLNGHGGNTSPLDVTLRGLKHRQPKLLLATVGYWEYAEEATRTALEGPLKGIQHACEAEVSLVMHVRPELVRNDALRNDGLEAVPTVKSPILHFDEITEEGSFGYATLATAEKGKAIFEASVQGVIGEVRALFEGFLLKGIDTNV